MAKRRGDVCNIDSPSLAFPLGQLSSSEPIVFQNGLSAISVSVGGAQKKRPGKMPGLWCVFSYLVKPTKLIL
ncbi:uncharacterized protein METZ01_LOCUS466054, partial [marine metagenome]